MPCIVSIHYYSVSHSAIQSMALSEKETQGSNISLERDRLKRGTWLTS